MFAGKSIYRSASVAALVVGLLSAVSQGASAATVSITNEVFTGNAPLTPLAPPVSTSGTFEQSVTGGDTPSSSGLGAGGRLSPYAFNTGPGPGGSAAATGAPYIVLGVGTPIASATYNLNSSSVQLLWGSPDPYNQVAFFSGPDGTGLSEGTFTSSHLACGSATCLDTYFDLVAFTASGGDIGSAVLSNSTSAAFESGGPTPVASALPLPGAIYLFGSVFGGAFWLGRRKRA